MFLHTKDGITCDICKVVYKDKFIYYSFDFNSIEVDSSKMFINNSGVSYDIDVCDQCFENFKKKIIISANKHNTIKCDLCSVQMTGKFLYYRVLIHKIFVDKSNTKNTTVEKNVFDLNVDQQCFKGISDMVMANRIEMKKKGEWS
jgi:hypothetical protein